eukprot:scaffold10802_cov57-Attheya_sp.AAC.4
MLGDPWTHPSGMRPSFIYTPVWYLMITADFGSLPIKVRVLIAWGRSCDSLLILRWSWMERRLVTSRVVICRGLMIIPLSTRRLESRYDVTDGIDTAQNL